MELVYKVEDIIESKDALLNIATRCWDEVDQMNTLYTLDPDWEQYTLMNQAGMIRYYTVYDDDKQVGFAIFMIAPSLHRKGMYIGTSDCVFLDKGYRGKGVEFINLIIDDLRDEKVHWFSLHIKSWMDSGKLGKAIGCTHYENVYQRSL